ncbi:sigma-70 family RNA polymerase sigma factor [Dokdonella sp.]|uniref:RNA polymerase sigma factor n=1 Tax=Dokdonella sp. TaxID=2291710 RepID=UPI002F4063CF
MAGVGMATVAQREQFEQLLERHRGIVLKIAHAYCRDAEDRRDLAQEIAAQLWKALPAWDRGRPFSTWMYRVALNVAISHARSAGERRHVPLDEAGVEPSHDADAAREADDGIRALYRCIERLDPLNRALMLLYLDERSQREIGEILGLSGTNVATKIGRLKTRIRNELGE